LSYRFATTVECEKDLTASLVPAGAGLTPEDRYRQERDLFAFFSNSFSVFESTFYGLFSLGAFVFQASFPIETAKDQQRISPPSTIAAMTNAFKGDPILKVIEAVTTDPHYSELREVRNILTHRAAPGRTFFVGIGADDVLADEWKIKNIPLDVSMAPTRRAEVARLLTELLQGVDAFAKAHL
jgi:hypothetical protein